MADAVRYVVRRLNWRWAGACFVKAPGEARVAAFDTPAEAEADRAAREDAVRGRVNPFRCGPALHYLTTMPEGVFRDWLEDAGVAPPAGPWPEWWDATRPALTADQVARVWDGLNRVRFHEVVARKPSEVAYAVVRVMWDWDDQFYHPGGEGGKPMVVFRSREKAEARCRQLEIADRTAWVDGTSLTAFVVDRWDEANWPNPGDGHGQAPDRIVEPVLYEVVEVTVG